MTGTTKEKKHVFLMGKPQVKKHGKPDDHPLPVSEDAEAMQLFALLLLSREFCPEEGVVTEQNEVRREWLLTKLYPDLFAAEPQQARDRMAYALKKLEAALQIRADKGALKRERNVVVAALDHLVIDVGEIEQAAKQIHIPKNQESIIALAERPLLDGTHYSWLQQPCFQAVRFALETHYLTALHRRVDSLVVQMEQANAQGKLAQADLCRSEAILFLDKSAQRLNGSADLSLFQAKFSDLRARASYPLPDWAALSAPPASRLPQPVTAFFGRAQEMAEVRDLLASGRLVTLTGMGGGGKTRLALEVAAALEAEDGSGGRRGEVRLVELAGLADPDLLPQALGLALGLAERPGVAVMEALIAHLRDGRALLLLDNCEHLLAACAGLVSTLLRACPALKVLATSREPLNIHGEYLCQVPPLPFPDPDDRPENAPDPVAALLRYDSARLFLDRALQFRRFTPGPENVRPIAAICAALEGSPLALELAAARVEALPVAQIAEMLSDRFGLLTGGRADSPARHRTLRAVIDWSYDLLDVSEQRLLCRLSVFAGGWTLDAAKAISLSGEDGGAADGGILELLTGLVDKSLVVAQTESTPVRYRMLETVRQYAQDCLREGREQDEIRRRHRAYYLRLAEDAEPQLKGPDPKPCLDRLEAEIGNFRAALGWRADQESLRLACALRHFWHLGDYLQEGRQWLERETQGMGTVSAAVRARVRDAAGGLAFSQGEFQEALRLHEEGRALWGQLEKTLDEERGAAASLTGLGAATAHLGDYEAAQKLYAESLRLMRHLGDHHGTAEALNGLAMIANYQYDYDTAGALLTESLALRRQIQDVRGIANSLYNLGIIAYFRTDYAAAHSLFAESLALWRPIGDRYSIAKALGGLGEIALHQCDYRAAQEYYRESLEMRRQTGDRYGIANSLNGLAETALHQGDYAAAKKLYEESLDLRRQMGDKQSIPHSVHNLGELALRRGDPVLACTLFRESLGLMRQNKDQFGIANSLEGLASAATSLGQEGKAVRLLAAAEALRQATGNARPPKVQDDSQTLAAALRAALGAEAVTQAGAEGRAMTWEQAVAFALEEDAP